MQPSRYGFNYGFSLPLSINSHCQHAGGEMLKTSGISSEWISNSFPLTPRRGLDLCSSFVYFFLVANLMHTIAVDITNMHSVWGPCEQKFWNNLAAICLSKSLYSQIVVWWDQQHLRRVIFRSSYAWLARGWKNTCWQPGGMFTA